MPHPAVETREFVDDERWPAYKDTLEAHREELVLTLARKHLDYPTMCRIAGEIAGLDYALGKPDELLKLDTPPSTP